MLTPEPFTLEEETGSYNDDVCYVCNKLADTDPPLNDASVRFRRDTTGSCRAHSPALHVGRRDRVAQWSCTSHPHAHLHAQLGLISASAAPSAGIHQRRRRARPHAPERPLARRRCCQWRRDRVGTGSRRSSVPAPHLTRCRPPPAVAQLAGRPRRRRASSAVYAVYAISSLDTEGSLRHRTQNRMKLRRDSTGSCRAHSPALHVGSMGGSPLWRLVATLSSPPSHAQRGTAD